MRLEEITPENFRLDLQVHESQKAFVASTSRILARAYAYRNSRSRALIIYHNEVPIGMALYYDTENAYDLSQFFIDARYQGNGYGYEAAKMILEEMRRDGVYKKVVLCYIDGNEAAKQLYLRLGFRHTGEADGNEIIMEKEFQ